MPSTLEQQGNSLYYQGQLVLDLAEGQTPPDLNQIGGTVILGDVGPQGAQVLGYTLEGAVAPTAEGPLDPTVTPPPPPPGP